MFQKVLFDRIGIRGRPYNYKFVSLGVPACLGLGLYKKRVSSWNKGIQHGHILVQRIHPSSFYVKHNKESRIEKRYCLENLPPAFAPQGGTSRRQVSPLWPRGVGGDFPTTRSLQF
jgi:hypothetical protein